MRGETRFKAAMNERRASERRIKSRMSSPFICPKCFRNKSLYCTVSSGTIKEKRKDYRGKEVEVKIPIIHYAFKCDNCGFRRIITLRQKKPTLFDTFHKLFDEEIDPLLTKGYIGKPVSDYRTITLGKCEVKM